MREVTEVRIDEEGHETHESWILIRANRAQVMGTSANLFGSDIPHRHVMTVTITRCFRHRQLNHDRLHGTEILLSLVMSEAQWGAFVSSIGDGQGVPATLEWFGGHVPLAPAESRFEQSHAEVRDAANRALAKIQDAVREVEEAFEGSAGRKVLREKLRNLHHAVGNAPANMEFAASSLTEHVETVVTKAKADIEAMILTAAEQGTLIERVEPFQLEPAGEPHVDNEGYDVHDAGGPIEERRW